MERLYEASAKIEAVQYEAAGIMVSLWTQEICVTLRHAQGNATIPLAYTRKGFGYYLKNHSGMALVVTLLSLAIITAMVVEFSYGVYTGTSNLYNWRDSQRLSLMAKSGINVSAKYLSYLKSEYTEPIELPVENPFEDFQGLIAVRIEDETSKFNINSIVYEIGGTNPVLYEAFKKLLRILVLDEKIADRIVDWIDRDSSPMLPDSETGAKNSALVSVDEMLLIRGIDKKAYDKLLPYITVYPDWRYPKININGAGKPVIMCLGDIDDRSAQHLIDTIKTKPLENLGQLENVIGSNKVPSGIIIYSGTVFYLRSSASSGGVKRIIEAVLNVDKGRIEYWKEY